MNAEHEKTGQELGKIWVWVLFEGKLEKLRRQEKLNDPRGPLNEIERKCAAGLALLSEGQHWALKHKFKGNTLHSMFKEFGGLTAQCWAGANSLVWLPEYKQIVGEKPKP